MNQFIRLMMHPISIGLAMLVLLYSIGFPYPLMRNPCVATGIWPSVYVLNPIEQSRWCYVLEANTWTYIP
jgi:hypothetical protein